MTAVIDTKLMGKRIALNEVPIVDIAPLLDNSDPKKVAKEIGYICENIGFLYIKNHGISDTHMDAVYQATKEFFALPMAEKEKLSIVHSGPTLRGYIPLYGENVDPYNSKDFKEAFDYGQNGSQVSPFFGHNLMPEQPLHIRKILEHHHDVMLDLSRKLVSAIALSLGLPDNFFVSRQQKPITIQRILRYPPQTGEITQEEIGIGAHTDYGFLTILSQDDNGGLQVQNANKEWIDAPPITGTFIVNIGDLVQTLTNGKYISTMHRVINTSGNERYSVPFFIDMDFDALIEPVPTCLKEGQTTPEPYTCGTHKYQRFVDSYAHLTQYID